MTSLFDCATAQWNSNASVNTAICTATNAQRDIRIVSDQAGGAIIAWEDLRTDNITSDIYVQRVDANGFVLWTTNGISAVAIAGSTETGLRMIEDGQGGAILVWNDSRNGNYDIFAQRINNNGAALWSFNGTAVVVKSSSQSSPVLTPNGNGGAIVVWQDSSAGNWDIYAQNIDSSGILLWNSNGIAVCTAPGDQINPRIVSDASLGAVFVWQDKRSGTDYSIYAQRVNDAGTGQWVANGIAVCSVAGTQNNPKIETDGNGHFVVAWPDKRNGTDYNVYAQALNLSGVVQWTVNGITVCSAAGNQTALDLIADTTGIFISWKDSRSGANTNIYMQRLNWAGATQWAANGIGVVVNAFNQVNPNLVPDGMGGTFVVWQDDRNGTANNDVYSQRINTTGTLLWSAAGIATGSAANDQLSPKQINDGFGNMIAAWHDNRNATDYNIYAQKVLASGSFPTAIESPALPAQPATVYPDPFSESALITWHTLTPGRIGRKQQLELTVYDVNNNQVIRTSVTGENQVTVERGHLSPGIYFFQVCPVNENKILSKGKFIISE